MVTVINMNNQLFNKTEQKERRRSLRNDMPLAEKKFWYMIRARVLGYKFRRQQGVGPYIVDFYCPKAKLAIELDGDSHYWEGRELYDNQRDTFLSDQGIKMLRFTNNDVLRNIQSVLARTLDALRKT